MTKRQAEAESAFRKEMARLANDLRQWIDAPLILIGKATLVLIERNEPVTFDSLRNLVSSLEDEKDADMVARTLTYIDAHSTDS